MAYQEQYEVNLYTPSVLLPYLGLNESACHLGVSSVFFFFLFLIEISFWKILFIPIRGHVRQRLIWVFTVCQDLIFGRIGMN